VDPLFTSGQWIQSSANGFLSSASVAVFPFKRISFLHPFSFLAGYSFHLLIFLIFYLTGFFVRNISFKELGNNLDFNTTSFAWGSFTLPANKKRWHFLQGFCRVMVTDYWRIMNFSYFIFSSFNTWMLRNVYHLVDSCHHQNCRFMHFTGINEDVFSLIG